MPDAPILDRETYFYRRSDGTYAFFDWNLVNTSLGAMVEPRPLTVVGIGQSYTAPVLRGLSADRIREITPETFFATAGVNGTQLPVDASR